MPSKRTMLLTETRENPMLTEERKKEETPTQAGEILVFLPIRLIILRTYMRIHVQGMFL